MRLRGCIVIQRYRCLLAAAPFTLLLASGFALPPESPARNGKSPEIGGPQSRHVAVAKSHQGIRAPIALPKSHPDAQARVVENFGKLPLSFEANQGQADPGVRFLSRGSGYRILLGNREAVLVLSKGTVNTGSAAKDGAVSDESADAILSLLGPAAAISRFVAGEKQEPAPPAVLKMQLVGALPASEVTGLDELPGKSNYLLGSDATQWRTNVPNYSRVQYKGIYPGIDLIYYGNMRQLEYDFVVAPGADPRAIALEMETGNWKSETGNAKFETRNPKLEIAANGDLVVKLEGGEVRFHKPVVYQQPTVNSRQLTGKSNLPGQATDLEQRTTDIQQSAIDNRQFLEGRYVLTAANRIQFEIPKYDKARPLVIDPTLSYSTYLGGTGTDVGLRVAVDTSGNAFLTGTTSSLDFPTSSGTLASHIGYSTCSWSLTYRNFYCPDTFVTKLNAGGTAILYSTYLGGDDLDVPVGIAVDSSGNAIVVGSTDSFNFPTTPGAFQISKRGAGDVFVSKLNPTGSGLVFSTYIGGSKDDVPGSSVVDASGNVYVVGTTSSSDFPVSQGAFQTTLKAGTCTSHGATFPCPDAFVVSLNAAGNGLGFSTYLGGSSYDFGLGIALAPSGGVWVTGATVSSDFPTAASLMSYKAGTCGPPKSTHPCADAFVAITGGPHLPISTYLGGSGDDIGVAIATDSEGEVYVTGITNSSDFPGTAGSAQPALSVGSCGTAPNNFNCPDAFVAKVDVLAGLLYATYLGGSSYELVWDLVTDASGRAFVTGGTGSVDFPTTSAIQATFGGGNCSFSLGGVSYALACPNAFVTGLSADGKTWAFSTFLGGSGGDMGFGIALDATGNLYISGTTVSANFPTANALQANLAGDSDAFLTKISPATVGPSALLDHTSLDFGKQAVNTSTTKTVTLTNNGDARLDIASIAADGDFANPTHDCGGSLMPTIDCTINVKFKPSQTGSRTGTLTITHNAVGGSSTVALSGIGTDFTMETSEGTPTEATVNAGDQATYKLTFTPNGLAGKLSLSCTGAPKAATCAVPTSLTLDGTTPAEVTVSVTTAKRSTLTPLPEGRPPAFGGFRSAPLLAGILLLLVLIAGTLATRRRAWALTLPLLCVLLWAACGGGGTPTQQTQTGTPAGTYPLTVTATYTTSSGSLSHNTTLSLKVN